MKSAAKGDNFERFRTAHFLKDGTRVECSTASGTFDAENGITQRDWFTRPIPLDEVDRVLLNGEEIPLHPENH